MDVMIGPVGQRRLNVSSQEDEDVDRAPPVEVVIPGASTVDDSSQATPLRLPVTA